MGESPSPGNAVFGPLERHFIAYGTRFEIRADDAAGLAALAARAGSLEWTASTASEPAVRYRLQRRSSGEAVPDFTLRVGDEVLAEGGVDEMLESFEDHAKLQTALHARDVIFVHAGAVSWRDRAIVIPGASRAGKSTLVRALLDEGATYYSDEFAVFDAAGHVKPYALPLSIRTDDPRRRLRIPIREPSDAAPGPVPVGLVVVTRYTAGARWRPRPLSRGKAFLALMANTVAARSVPERAMKTLSAAVAPADAVTGVRGDARRAARAILAAAAW